MAYSENTVKTLLRELSKNSNEQNTPWDGKTLHYYISSCIVNGKKELSVYSTTSFPVFGGIYFANKKIAEQALKIIQKNISGD